MILSGLRTGKLRAAMAQHREALAEDAGDDGRVNVKARSIEFFAAAYELEKIVAGPDGSVHATASIHEEGEPDLSQGDIYLTLLDRDKLFIRAVAAGGHSYFRCR